MNHPVELSLIATSKDLRNLMKSLDEYDAAIAVKAPYRVRPDLMAAINRSLSRYKETHPTASHVVHKGTAIQAVKRVGG